MRSLVCTCLLCIAVSGSADEWPVFEVPTNERVKFVERTLTPMLQRPRTARGELWVEEDGTLVMQVSEPNVEERRLSHEAVVLIRPKGNRLSAGKRHVQRRLRLDADKPAHRALQAIPALLRGDTDMLKGMFDLSQTSPLGTQAMLTEEATWQRWLLPTSREVAAHLTWIRLDADASRPERLNAIHIHRGSESWQYLQLLHTVNE